jgi:hypothetical protein
MMMIRKKKRMTTQAHKFFYQIRVYNEITVETVQLIMQVNFGQL